MTTLALLALSIVPALREPLRDDVDVIFREHVYDGEGRLTFTQDIYIIEACIYGQVEEQIIAWRMVKGDAQDVHSSPRGYYQLYHDGETMRLIRARSFREEWHQHDSEILARERLPQCERRELRKP